MAHCRYCHCGPFNPHTTPTTTLTPNPNPQAVSDLGPGLAYKFLKALSVVSLFRGVRAGCLWHVHTHEPVAATDVHSSRS